MLTKISRRRVLAFGGYSLGIPALSVAIDSGTEAPKFYGKTLDGEKFDNRSLLDKIVLIEFWATWCPYCKSDARPLDDLAKEFEKDGLMVLAVDVAESKKTVKNFLVENPRRAKIVLMDDTNLAAMFAAKSFPKYVLLSRTGRVIGEQNGAGGEALLRRTLRKAGLGTSDLEGEPIQVRSSPRRG